MKLLYCPKCQDIIRLIVEKPKSCDCGECSGQYDADGRNAWHTGGIPMGICNRTFSRALKSEDRTRTIHAFMIPTDCKTYKKREQL